MPLAQLFKLLSDDTRLHSVLLIKQHQELCVCELTEALAISQPKISRHLAQLRQSGLLQDRRRGQWVFYRLADELSDDYQQIIEQAAKAVDLTECNQRLGNMQDRPCC
ncbi:metalloregulator ArsR/SmtB family transcription factor [Salinibius halmophilus]|uniref:metalloregulator ArsR/SmtB family transcription factor n=1 Tax=Salinibius halmophilus TaxID=1853216 RepID=UPI000E66F235|nr:metalloregulator ArsR/SmtB family transcription factor [Salinibius halmophilus]